MLFIFFVALALANKCSYDHQSKNGNYQDGSIYNERYCDTTCPCKGADCEMDFTESPIREVYNVSGEIGTLITRAYDLTFALYVSDVFSAKNVVLKSKRTQYKLADKAYISIGAQAVEVNNTEATGDTIFRCAGECNIVNTELAKKVGESISFIAEKDVSSKYHIAGTTFHVTFGSNAFSQVYARENVEFVALDAKFVVDADAEQLNKNAETPIPLIYNVKGFPETKTVSVVATGKEYTVEAQCDGHWLVAVPTGLEKKIDCFDPTITTGSQSLEDGCEITFIVIICVANLTLIILVAVFAILALLPFIKRKLGKGEDDYNKFDELTK